MLYAILCYNSEDVVFSWTKAEDDAVMAKLSVIHDRLVAEGVLEPLPMIEGHLGRGYRVK